jgi:hypothetical protein
MEPGSICLVLTLVWRRFLVWNGTGVSRDGSLAARRLANAGENSGKIAKQEDEGPRA